MNPSGPEIPFSIARPATEGVALQSGV